MMRIALAASVTFAASVAIAATPQVPREYILDRSHTDVAFSIGFLGHPVRGRFDEVHGTISYAEKNPAASGVSIVIAVQSISTGSAHRDDHLRSPDFFDAAKYPNIVFRSTSIVQRKDSLYATGTLLMHGVSRAVTIPFRQTQAPFDDPHGASLVFFSGALRLDRKDFGILGGSKYNDWFDEIRSATMSDSVDISLDVTGWQPDPTRTTRYDEMLRRIDEHGIDASLARINTIALDTLKQSLYDVEQIARALAAHGRAELGIRVLETTVARLETEPSAHTALARAYELAGRRDLAIEQTTRALALDSLDTRALELARRLGMAKR